MVGARDEAERVVRDFARRTNLQLAGRPFRVSRPDAVGASARALLTALGGLEVGTDSTAPGLLEIGDEVLLDGAPVPNRGDASGRIDFARAHMHTSVAMAERLRESGTVSGLRIGVAMTLEPKTANLALLLRDAGAEVAVYAHPDETDPEVAAALAGRGVAVDADASLSGAAERAAALAFLERGFDVVMDDGSHLIRLAHEVAPHLVARWIGACEETTSGLTPLRAMEADGLLATPVIAVNDAATKTSFDNRYGTGQSCVFAIADVLDAAGITLRDQPALVIGYGPVGQGVAAHLRAFGATVAVSEADPVRALLAAHDGFEVGPAADLHHGALVISATGAPKTMTVSEFSSAVALAVAGGVPGEIDLRDVTFEPVAPHLERVGATLILDRGGCINITAAEGNPIEIMDLSFATQLSALEYLVTERLGLGVHPLPADAVNRVARLALAARGLHAEPAPASGTVTDWRSPRYR
jgi:adenosylhomocysteinase